jgi:predicted metal-binding protein
LSKHPLIHSASPPVDQAIVFICEKCGKRSDSDKNRSHRLASKLKRSLKANFSKGDIRIALTSCMDLCPEDRITVSLQPVDPDLPSIFWEVDMDDLEEGSEELAAAIGDALHGS